MRKRHRPLSPDDPGWSPLGPPPAFADRLLEAVRLGVAQGVERYLDKAGLDVFDVPR